MNGVIYIAYGDTARREVTSSIAGLWQHNDLPVKVITSGCDWEILGAECIWFDDPTGTGMSDMAMSRWAKVNLDKLSPWHNTCYLDADTRIHGDISPGFASIEDGYDIAICPSTKQGNDAFWHVGTEERMMTLEMLQAPLQLQAGVFFFSRGRCGKLFQAWRKRWLEFKGQDQAALSRAMEDAKPRVWLLGRTWNGGPGDTIEHIFGRCR